MSEFLELEDEEDIPCCPETPEPFPDFSIKSLDELGPCTLAITRKEYLDLLYTFTRMKGEIPARITVAEAFVKHFKIEII
jgi:hypothetical protein